MVADATQQQRVVRGGAGVISADDAITVPRRVGEVAILYFRTTAPPLDKPEVRKAIAYALDREEFLALFGKGIAEIVYSPVPVRFLAAPALVAMIVMLPALTFWSDAVALLGAGLYVSADLGITLQAFFDQARTVLEVGDLLHGLAKSLLFAVLVTIVGVVNGASVTGGAEGVGRMTTRSVVHSIAAIVITDMVLAFLLTR